MSRTTLETKPLDQLTATDVEAFVAGWHIREGQTLEFKQALGDDFALRRAVCGFANAYGGTFVLGVAERDKVAAEIVPVPDCETQAETLWRSLEACVSPPLSGLALRGVPTAGDAGVVVARIAASARRPHSVSKPKRSDALHVFVRRGAETKPADIREVQDMTLAAAAQSERVTERLTSLQAPFLEHWREQPAGHAHPYWIHACAAPTTPVALPRAAADRAIRLSDVKLQAPIAGGMVTFPRWGESWRAIFRGQQLDDFDDEMRFRASVHDDGACEIEFGALPRDGGVHSPAELHLAWYVAVAVGVSLWCERIRKATQEPALEFAAAWLNACGSDRVAMKTAPGQTRPAGLMTRGLHRARPMLLSVPDDAAKAANHAVTDFFNLCGQAGPAEDVPFDLRGVRSAWGLDG